MYEVHADQHPHVIAREFDIAWRDERPLTVHSANGYPDADQNTEIARQLVESLAASHSSAVIWYGDVAEFTTPIPALRWNACESSNSAAAAAGQVSA